MVFVEWLSHTAVLRRNRHHRIWRLSPFVASEEYKEPLKIQFNEDNHTI